MFTAPSFLQRACIYEVNIRQYTPEGSFRAFSGHLPRLKDMGVDILWLMPVFPIGEVRRKGELGSYYSIRDFEKVNPEFGTAEDLTRLIEEIHRLGMKVILDWVANHTAHDHVWTHQHPEFYVKDESGDFYSPFDWSDVIQLDHGNMLQQEAMVQAMQFWIREFNIDGFRADLAHLTPLPFWKKARKAAEDLKPGLIWLAETEDPAYHEAFDISFTWKWMHATEKICRGERPLSDLSGILEEYSSDFPPSAFRMFFTSNHDENSWNGTEFEKYGKYSGLLAVFSFLYRSVPLIYSGQEIPNRVRLPFFSRNPIIWPESPAMHGFYKGLSVLRHTRPELFSSDNSEKVPVIFWNDELLLFYRESGPDVLLVLLNFGKGPVTAGFPLHWPEGSFEDWFTGRSFHLKAGCELKLEEAEALVLLKKTAP